MNKKYKTAIEILNILETKKCSAYIIGGYSRDKYFGKINSDIDITTSAKYKTLKKTFPEIEENKFNSYKLKYKEFEFEITTFRKEKKYLKNRYPKKVTYTKSLKKDLKRRDFVINTLCINSKEQYIDLLNARRDIDRKQIRLIGSKKRLKEDALRILRAIRFATILNFKIDKKLDKAITKYKETLLNISFDRKKQEIEKILSDKNYKYGIELIKKYDIEKYLKIDLSDYKPCEQKTGIWAQILIDDSYQFNKVDKKSISQIKKLLTKPYNAYNLYKYGPNIMKTVCEIKQEEIDIYKEYENMKIKDRDDIEIDYLDICKNIEANNENINEIYEDLEHKIVFKQLKNEKLEIIKYLKQKYQK